MAQHRRIMLIIVTCLLLATAGCSYNPFREDNQLTGSATYTAVGAGVGVLGAAAAGGSKAEMGIAGVAGGLIGYYASTLRFASGGIMHAGGQVYTVGQYITIEIPSDQLFDVNSSDLLPGAGAILDSVVSVLNRYPNNNILVSGNTSGFYSAKFERKLSEDRARQVAAYLWAHGINNFSAELGRNRKLNFVGYSNYFPISNDIQPKGVRQNSRIQITSYPSKEDLGLDKKHQVFGNIGDSSEETETTSNKDSAAAALSGGTNLPDNPPPADSNFSLAENDTTSDNIKNEMWDNYNTVQDEPAPNTAPLAAENNGTQKFKDQ